MSVIVVCRNERDHIEACLQALLAQEIGGPFEVVAVDGESTDGTREAIETLAARDARLGLVANPRCLIAPGRNTGIEMARAPLVAFTDADCVQPAGWLQRLVQGYERLAALEPQLVGVGGGNVVPARAGRFPRAVGIARSNFWGNHGSVQGNSHARPTFVDHLPTVNVLYEKRALQAIGGFDASFGNIAEDVDLSVRLTARGGRFAYLPDCDVDHWLVSGPREWLSKMVIYGRGRAWLLRKHGIASVGWRFLLPLAFLAYLAAAVPLGVIWPQVWIPAALYLGLTAVMSLYAAFAAGAPRLVPLVFVVYLMTHLPYAAGELHGLLQSRESFRWSPR